MNGQAETNALVSALRLPGVVLRLPAPWLQRGSCAWPTTISCVCTVLAAESSRKHTTLMLLNCRGRKKRWETLLHVCVSAQGVDLFFLCRFKRGPVGGE